MTDKPTGTSSAHEDISDALDKLAAHGSPDQIAAHLAEQGHVGEQMQGDHCPVSNYVYATTGRRISIGGRTWGPVGVDVNLPTPRIVGDFIGRFDGNKYPELIKADES